MNPKEIIKSIQCAAPHECPNETSSPQSKACIYCDINYSFISKEPVLLECQHHICHGCVDKAKGLNCKICNTKIKMQSSKNRIVELVIESNLKDLFGDLKSKFTQAHVIYKSRFFNISIELLALN